MRIREIWMKNFGRFADRRITVNDGIQLFYGENEAGKSTIHTFLKGMLFGMERKRGRASATDESHLYEPWENPNYYAGVLKREARHSAYRDHLKKQGERQNCSVRKTEKNFR